MVRKAAKDDIPVILRLLLQVDMVHHEGRPDLFKGPATKYDEAQLEKIIDDPATPVFVYDDGCVKGHAFCIHRRIIEDPVLTDIKTLYIDDICVDESSRGQGVGRALYDHVVSYAKEAGCYNITLNVWTCNPGALAFYEAMGLLPQKICMEKIL